MSLKQEIRNLAEQYEIRVTTCTGMLAKIPFEERNTSTPQRLLTKRGCYEATAAELQQILQQYESEQPETCENCGKAVVGWNLCDECEFTER